MVGQAHHTHSSGGDDCHLPRAWEAPGCFWVPSLEAHHLRQGLAGLCPALRLYFSLKHSGLCGRAACPPALPAAHSVAGL